jgi:lipid-A-disaccharide synthase
VVTGEASGDAHAADLVRALRAAAPGLGFFGMGGVELRRAGMEVLIDIGDLAVMGLAEVASSLGRAYRAYREILGLVERRRPVAALLVDFPDFNLRLARAAHGRGIRVVYFIAPQIWAWRQGRVRALARDVDRILCILPFETGFYRDHGARAVFVGHPLIDQMLAAPQREPARRRFRIGDSSRVLALLPGSRRQEVRAILPDMLGAARRLRQQAMVERVLLPLASTLGPGDILEAAGGAAALEGIQMVPGAFLDVLAAADGGLVASGTATLAAAVMGMPMVLGYRVHPLTFALGRRLTSVPHIGLVNLVAGREVVPELIQDDLTGENLARLALPLLTDPAEADRQRRAFIEVRARLGPPGVAERAAEAVLAALAPPRPAVV